jgi:hypothetical protein
MKKGLMVLGVILGVAILTLFAYLIYKTWIVFGFWTLAWTGLVTSLSGTILGQMIGSRKDSNGKIMYNPKEWPKFVNIIICVLVGYYLYTIISAPNVDKGNYYFGLIYLILLTALPTIYAIYKLFRDRNDFVELDEKYISYKDNAKTGKFEISKISKIEGALTIHFNDETTHTIALSNMNFNSIDITSLKKDIQSRLPNIENNDINESTEQ